MRAAKARDIASVLLAAFAAAAAHAQSVSQSADVTVTGSVGRMCILQSPQVNLSSATNISQVSGATVTIAELSDGASLTTRSADFTASFGGMCNFGHRLTISSDRGGLFRDPVGAATPGFANGVPYRATVNWSGSTSILRADAASEAQVQQQLSIDTPAQGDVALHFHIDQGATNAGAGAPLVAGTYDDTIRVTMGPL